MKNYVRRYAFAFLIIYVVSCVVLPGNATIASYPPGQLSTEDMQILEDAYDDIRSEFERRYLPHFVLDERSTGLARGVLEQDEATLDWVHFVWTAWVSEVIFYIQRDSSDTYQLPERQVFSELTSDELSQLIDDYIPLIQEAGMSSYEQFDVSFIDYTDNGALMLLDFHNTDSSGASKYISIVVEDDGNRHFYFADSLEGSAGLETYPEMGGMFFCGELISDGEANYWYVESTKDAFIESIHASLEGTLEFAPIFNLVVPDETMN